MFHPQYSHSCGDAVFNSGFDELVCQLRCDDTLTHITKAFSCSLFSMKNLQRMCDGFGAASQHADVRSGVDVCFSVQIWRQIQSSLYIGVLVLKCRENTKQVRAA